MPSIDTAKEIVMLRNSEHSEGEESEYYEEFYNVELSKLRELFIEVATCTYSIVNEDNMESVGLAWFLVAYELGRSHQAVINDIGEY